MIQKLSDSELIQKLRSLVTEERKLLAELLEYLREVDRRKLYADFGHSSLWHFCIHELKYSEGCAARRIKAMQLLRDLPEVKEDLLEGKQTLSTLSLAQSFFGQEEIKSSEEKRAVLTQIEGSSARECQEKLNELSHSPKELPALKLPISKELLEKLEKLKALRSHASQSLEDLLDYMADEMLKKLDPEQKPQSPPTPAVNRVSASVRRFVWQRDQGKCTQCGSRHFLEVDHIRPRARGGAHTPENLRLLCRAHNQRAAVRAGLPQRD
jgi:hypothetical protein